MKSLKKLRDLIFNNKKDHQHIESMKRALQACQRETFENKIVLEMQKSEPNLDTMLLYFMDIVKIGGSQPIFFILHENAFINKPEIQRQMVENLIYIPGLNLMCRRDIHERTPLMEAAKIGNLEVVKLLIMNGSPINLQDTQGNTALLLASKHGHSDVFHALLDAGANEEIENSHGERAWTALHPNITRTKHVQSDDEIANVSISEDLSALSRTLLHHGLGL